MYVVNPGGWFRIPRHAKNNQGFRAQPPYGVHGPSCGGQPAGLGHNIVGCGFCCGHMEDFQTSLSAANITEEKREITDEKDVAEKEEFAEK